MRLGSTELGGSGLGLDGRWESGETPIGRAESFALRSLVAWHLGDAKLAHEVAALEARPRTKVVVPYRVEAAA